MSVAKTEVIQAIKASVKKLQEGMNAHCCLVSSVLEQQLDEQALQAFFEVCPKRNRELRLEAAITEAIDVLEESRKSFKSKQLAALRRKLTQALIEAD
jgi:hypothetical protein